MNYSNNENDTPGPLGGKKGFAKQLAKSRKAGVSPEVAAHMRKKAGSATNKLMRNKILADYGLNILDGDTESLAQKRYR